MKADVISGTITYTEGENRNGAHWFRIAWTSTAGGAAELDNIEMYGTLNRMVTNPGTAAPTANYDITLVDINDSQDALQGLGANRHTTTTEEKFIYYSGTLTEHPVVVGGWYNFVVANAGAAKNGTCTFFWR